MSKANQIEAVLDWADPITHVFHLAARTFVPDSMDDPCGVVETNLQGTMRLLTGLSKRGGNVRTVFIGSSEAYGSPQSVPITEDHPLCPNNPYAMTKAALISMTKTFAVELGRSGIRINAIAPGLVHTRLAAALTSSDEALKIYNDHTALGRPAEPREIAGLAAYLASDASSYVTGQTLCVDGGYTVV